MVVLNYGITKPHNQKQFLAIVAIVFGAFVFWPNRNPDSRIRSFSVLRKPRKARKFSVVFEVDNLEGNEGQKGTFTIETEPNWAPNGVVRFQELVEAKFFDENRVFRVVPGLGAFFGINGDPVEQAKWEPIRDDPSHMFSSRGAVSLVYKGPNTRNTQIFINVNEGINHHLDMKEFVPIGYVSQGMSSVTKLFAEYGDTDKPPDERTIEERGNKYLKNEYPRLSYITNAYFKTTPA